MSTATMEGIEAPSSSHKLLMASIGLNLKDQTRSTIADQSTVLLHIKGHCHADYVHTAVNSCDSLLAVTTSQKVWYVANNC